MWISNIWLDINFNLHFVRLHWTDLVDGVDDLDIKTQSDKIHVSARRNRRE